MIMAKILLSSLGSFLIIPDCMHGTRVYVVLHAHALLPSKGVVGMVLEWMVKQQFNFFAQLECEMSSPSLLVTLSNCCKVELDPE